MLNRRKAFGVNICLFFFFFFHEIFMQVNTWPGVCLALPFVCFLIVAKAVMREYISHLQQLRTQEYKRLQFHLSFSFGWYALQKCCGFLMSLTIYLLCHFRSTSYSSKLQDSDSTLNPGFLILSFGLQFDSSIWYLELVKAKIWDREKYYCLVVLGFFCVWVCSVLFGVGLGLFFFCLQWSW